MKEPTKCNRIKCVFTFYQKVWVVFFYCLAYKSMLHVMLIVFEGKHVGCVFSLTRLRRSVLGCV
jgi:hypothetical protein